MGYKKTVERTENRSLAGLGWTAAELQKITKSATAVTIFDNVIRPVYNSLVSLKEKTVDVNNWINYCNNYYSLWYTAANTPKSGDIHAAANTYDSMFGQGNGNPMLSYVTNALNNAIALTTTKIVAEKTRLETSYIDIKDELEALKKIKFFGDTKAYIDDLIANKFNYNNFKSSVDAKATVDALISWIADFQNIYRKHYYDALAIYNDIEVFKNKYASIVTNADILFKEKIVTNFNKINSITSVVDSETWFNNFKLAASEFKAIISDAVVEIKLKEIELKEKAARDAEAAALAKIEAEKELAEAKAANDIKRIADAEAKLKQAQKDSLFAEQTQSEADAAKLKATIRSDVYADTGKQVTEISFGKINWKLWGGISTGIVGLATVAYFINKSKKNKERF